MAVGFALHDLELLPTDAEDRVVGHLGPDLLDPAWDDAHAAEALRRFTARGRPRAGAGAAGAAGDGGRGQPLQGRGVLPARPVAVDARARRPRPGPGRSRCRASCCCATRTGPSSRPPGELGRGRQHWVFERAEPALLPVRHPDPRSASRATACTPAWPTGARGASPGPRRHRCTAPRPARPARSGRHARTPPTRAGWAASRECAVSWCRAAAPGGWPAGRPGPGRRRAGWPAVTSPATGAPRSEARICSSRFWPAMSIVDCCTSSIRPCTEFCASSACPIAFA